MAPQAYDCDISLPAYALKKIWNINYLCTSKKHSASTHTWVEGNGHLERNGRLKCSGLYIKQSWNGRYLIEQGILPAKNSFVFLILLLW